MRRELERLHAEMLHQLDELERLTTGPEPQMDALSATRLALTRASRSRTARLNALYDTLLRTAEPEARPRIEALRDEAKSALAASSAHIGRWTIREITGHWEGYCTASRTLRKQIRARIAAEKRILLPLLPD